MEYGVFRSVPILLPLVSLTWQTINFPLTISNFWESVEDLEVEQISLGQTANMEDFNPQFKFSWSFISNC